MSTLKMSDEDKEKIRQQHKTATDNFYKKKEEIKKGIQIPEKKEEPKKEDPTK